jgi:hypothetical protein
MASWVGGQSRMIRKKGPPSAGDGSQLIPGPGSSLAKTLQAIDTDARGSSVISYFDLKK